MVVLCWLYWCNGDRIPVILLETSVIKVFLSFEIVLWGGWELCAFVHLFFHSGIIIGHSPCEKAIQTSANRRKRFPYIVHESSQNNFFTVIQLSLQLGLNLQKRDIWFLLWVLHGKHNTNNFTEEGYLPARDDGTALDLFNCRVDAFLLQVVVSQILAYISCPVQAHSMKELEWRVQPWNLKFCGFFKLQSGRSWTSVRGNKGTH